jgi:hypothetical protein
MLGMADHTEPRVIATATMHVEIPLAHRVDPDDAGPLEETVTITELADGFVGVEVEHYDGARITFLDPETWRALRADIIAEGGDHK